MASSATPPSSNVIATSLSAPATVTQSVSAVAAPVTEMVSKPALPVLMPRPFWVMSLRAIAISSFVPVPNRTVTSAAGWSCPGPSC